MVRSDDDAAAFLDVVVATQMTLGTPERLAQDIDDTERAVALADRLADPVLRIRTRLRLVGVRYGQCDIVGADSAIAEMDNLAQQIGLPYYAV